MISFFDLIFNNEKVLKFEYRTIVVVGTFISQEINSTINFIKSMVELTIEEQLVDRMFKFIENEELDKNILNDYIDELENKMNIHHRQLNLLSGTKMTT